MNNVLRNYNRDVIFDINNKTWNLKKLKEFLWIFYYL